MSKNKSKFFSCSLIWIILIGVIWVYFLPKYVCPKKYSHIVEKYSAEYQVDESLVYSIIKAESGFNPNAISQKSAMGLMQIMEPTGVWAAEQIGIDGFEIDMLFEPEVNIRIGCWYIARLLKQYDGDINHAVIAYNAGSGNVSKWLNDTNYSSDGISVNNIPFKETRNYLLKVRIFMKIYDIRYKAMEALL